MFFALQATILGFPGRVEAARLLGFDHTTPRGLHFLSQLLAAGSVSGR
jgi:hypothetical protein